MRNVLALVLGVGLLASATTLHAETPPNFWDRVKDPTLADSYEAHIYVQRLLFAGGGNSYDPSQVARFELDAALATLRAAGAGTSPDSRLRSDLLEVLGERENRLLEDHGDERRALALALCADDHASDHDRATACTAVAIMHAKADRTEDEIAFYAIALRYETDPGQRATVMMNRAESYMRLGRLRDAIEGYREVLAIVIPMGTLSGTNASANWGLAVALDRYRDTRGALDAATIGLMIDGDMKFITPEAPNSPVFFVPKYDAHWYRAVAWRAAALRPGTTPSGIAFCLGLSEAEYENYVLKAQAANDKMYIDVAKERLAAVRKLHADAVKRAPRPKADIDE
jgi:tetratricopeptide (TPR) repeat protein